MAPKDQPQSQHSATKLDEDTDSTLGQQRQTSNKQYSSEWNHMVLDTWFPEVIAVIFSGACFFAIIVILRSYEGEPVPALSIGLSLNAILSILSTASRTALIFVASETIGQWKWIRVKRGSRRLQGLQALDDASRGPWGARVLLFHRVGRSLASLGAVITILALAFEPFMQQLLTYPIRQTFHVSEQTVAKQVRTFLPTINDEGFLYAVERGFWSTDLRFSPSCPSGNCTWALFTSLGFCSQGEDVAAEAGLENCRNVPADPSVDHTTYTACNVTLPYGDASQEPIHVEVTGLGRTMRIPINIIWVPSVFGQAPMDVERGKARNELLAIAQAKLAVTTEEDTDQPHPENGLHIDEVTNYQYILPSPIGDGYSCTPNPKKWGLPIETACWTPSGNICQVPVVSVSSETGTSAPYANDSAFTICPDFNVYRQLAFLFAGSTFQSWNSLGDNITLWNLAETQGRPLSMNARRILASGLEEVTADVAAFMTKYAQQRSNWTITGQAGLVESYVHVHWTWLVLPALLLGAGTVLLGCTIVINRAGRLELWKSSIFPLLFHGLDTASIARSADIGTVSQMDKLAQETQARLQDLGNGRLVLNNDIHPRSYRHRLKLVGDIFLMLYLPILAFQA
ncbi:hypothetical protein BJX66DRAFT_343071 [Aspergillus keveii]|uniref:Uncharacterized protein n=1 Tax=Aspergillus keveii TaxID=714993 RepID=A0ABR4FQD7_9EURO